MFRSYFSSALIKVHFRPAASFRRWKVPDMDLLPNLQKPERPTSKIILRRPKQKVEPNGLVLLAEEDLSQTNITRQECWLDRNDMMFV